MNNERINSRSDAPSVMNQPGVGDDVACVNCGAVALDTGLECDECGWDNSEVLTGKKWHATKPAAPVQPQEIVGWLVSSEEGDDDFVNNPTTLVGRHYKGGDPIPLGRITTQQVPAQEPVAWVREHELPIAKVCHDLAGHIGWRPGLTELPLEGTELFTATQAAASEGWRMASVNSLTCWRDAFAVELDTWDIDPPLHHVKTSHDEIDALLNTPPVVAPVQDEYELRGLLASSLKCWHRLTGEEADDLVRFAANTPPAAIAAQNTATHEHLSRMIGFVLGARDRRNLLDYKDGSIIDRDVCAAVEHLKDWPYPPPAAQPERKPVAWVNRGENIIERVAGWDGYGALYTTPPAQPAQQEPVAWEDVLGAIARGWGHPENARKTMDVVLAVAIAKEIQDLYTTPPAAQPKREWVGLTDKQMVDAIEPLYQNRATAEMAAKVSMDEFRAIEVKLKEKNNG
jgi:hypothetical protein